MSVKPWPTVSTITNGSAVDAASVNPAITRLAQRTEALKQALSVLGSDGTLTSLVLPDEAIAGGVVAGDVVYLTSTNWAKAQATAAFEDQPVLNPQANACGIVLVVNDAVADILVGGKISFDALSFSASDMLEPGKTFETGAYYLSAAYPGKITKSKPDVAVLVGLFNADEGVVNFSHRDNADAHGHLSYVLKGKACGTVLDVLDENIGSTFEKLFGYFRDNPTEGESWTNAEMLAEPLSLGICGSSTEELAGSVTLRYFLNGTNQSCIEVTLASGYTNTTILASSSSTERFPIGASGLQGFFIYATGKSLADIPVDSTWTLSLPGDAQGWAPLPPDLDIGEGQDALLYSYNVGTHTELNQAFPPIPLASFIFVKAGVELASEARFPGKGVYRAELSGLYWTDTNPASVPWNDGIKGVDSQSVIYFTRRSSGGTDGVTSLTPKSGAGVKFYRKGTSEEASTGDLEAALDLNIQSASTSETGALVVKDIQGNQAKRGYVVEKLLVGGGLSLVPVAGSPTGQGTVMLTFGNTGSTGSFDTIALENARSDRLGMFSFTRLPAYRAGAANGAFTASFQVPHTLPNTAYDLFIYAQVFGSTAVVADGTGTVSTRFAYAKLEYSILPSSFVIGPSGEITSPGTFSLLNARDLYTANRTIAVPIGQTDTDGVTAGSAYTAYAPYLLHNDDSVTLKMPFATKALGASIPVDGEITALESGHIRPGSVVSIRVSAAASSGTDAYTGDLCFMDLRWKLVAKE